MTEIPSRRELLKKIRKLQQSTDSYRTLIENTQDLFYRADLDGRISFVSPSVYSLSGYTVEEAINMHLAEEIYLFPEDRKRFLSKIMTEGQVSNFEAQLKRKDGSVWWASTNAHTYKDQEGNALGVEGTTRDITDLKRSETNYRSIFNAANDAIFIHDMETGQILDVNQKMCEMYGYNPEKVSHINVEDLSSGVAPYTQENALQFIKKAVDGDPQLFEWMAKDSNGKLFWTEVNLKRVNIEGNERLLAIVRDISDRKQAEIGLKEREQRYHDLFSQTNEGLIVLTLDGQIIEVNQAFADMHGFTIDEIKNVDIRDLDVLKEKSISGRYDIIKLLQKGETVRFNAEHYHKDGYILFLSVTTSMINVSGTQCYLAFHQDITERKETEKALQKSEQRLSLALDSVSDGLWDWRVDTGEVYYSPRWFTMLGYDPDEFPHEFETWRILTHPDDVLSAEKTVLEYIESSNPFEIEFRMKTKNGKWKWILGRGKTVEKDDQGNVIRAVGTHVDITERKQIQNQLHESETRFRGMFEHMASGVAVYKSVDSGNDFIIEDFNPAAEKITNIKREKVIGNRLLDYFPNMRNTGFLTELQNVWKTGQAKHLEPFYYKDSIREGWRENRVYKLPSGEIVALFDDVTERRQAQLNLEKALEDTLRQKKEISALLEASRAIPLCKTFKETARNIFDIGKDTIGAKSGYVALLSNDGQANEVLFLEAGGLPCTVNPDLPMTIRGLREVAYNTQKVSYDNNFSQSKWMKYMPAGHVELKNVLFAPLNIQDETVGIMGLANKPEGFDENDIHIASAFGDLAAVALTYAQSQEELVRSEEKFAKSFDNAPLMMTISSLEDGRYLDINNRFTHLTGYTKDVAIGSTSVEIGFISKTDRDLLKKELMDKGHIHDIELELTKADGSIMYSLYSGELITIGEKQRLLSLAADISERKKMEQRLQQAQKMESIGSLAGGIAHDFNNILFPILGMSEMLIDDLPDGSPDRENVQEILKAGKRGADLVQQILSFSRQREHKIIPVRVQQILKEVLKLTRASIPTNIEMEQKIQSDCSLVMADPTQFHQIAMNIITNAFHAVESQKGKISIQLKEIFCKKAI